MSFFVLHTNQRLLAEELHRRQIDVAILEKESEFLQCTYGTHTEYLLDRYSSLTSHVAMLLTADKFLTKKILSQAGIVVPQGGIFDSQDSVTIERFITDHLHFPLVIKPNRGSHGKNVFMNIQNIDSCIELLALFPENTPCIIEEHILGKEYRVFITREKKCAVVYREPAYVIGNGIDTISFLIDAENTQRQDRKRYALYPIIPDEYYISGQGYTLNFIPAQDQKIYVRENSNIATGGVCINVTQEVDPEVIDICYKALMAFPGLAYGGIDFITEDISNFSGKYAIIEVNSNPSFSIHMLPKEGSAQPVASWVADMLFPETKQT